MTDTLGTRVASERGPSYRGGSEAYDLGYQRGFINAPRSEHYEHYDSAGWLEGWLDGQQDWVPGNGGFIDP